MIHTKTQLLTKSILFDIHIMDTKNTKTPVQQRFEMLIKRLNISIYALAARIEVSQSRLWRALEKQKGVDSELLHLISLKYPHLNMDWLVTGRGSMVLENALDVVQEPMAEYTTSSVRVVYKHQLKEYGMGCLDAGYIRKLPLAPVGVGQTGTYRDFEQDGSNMQDTAGNGINHGDIIRCQQIPPDQWQQTIQPGQVVVVVTAKATIIRMVKEINDESITLKSWNNLYKEEQVPLSHTVEIWLYHSLHTTRDFKHKLYE